MVLTESIRALPYLFPVDLVLTLLACSLCNACGLHYAKVVRRERMSRSKKRKHSIESILNKDKKEQLEAATPVAVVSTGSLASSNADADARSSDDSR